MTTSTVTSESGDLRVAGSAVPAAGSATADQVSDESVVVAMGTVEATVSEPIELLLAEGCADRRAPGRPRSARADEAIIEAVLDLLAEEGATIEALSMEAVASRAGVGKATIYRRWPNKEALVVDALAALKGPMPEVSGESLRADLLSLMRPMVAVKSTRAGRVMPCLIPELQRNTEMARSYHKLTAPRRELMRSVLRHWIDAGVLRADLDVETIHMMLMGPLMAQTMLNWNPSLDTAALPEKIIDTMLPGILATPGRVPAS